MSKYIFKMIDEEGFEVEVKSECILLSDLLENFKSFLLGCTFSTELVDRVKLIGN